MNMKNLFAVPSGMKWLVIYTWDRDNKVHCDFFETRKEIDVKLYEQKTIDYMILSVE